MKEKATISVLEKQNHTFKRKKLDSNLICCVKIDSSWITKLNTKSETWKSLEENRGHPGPDHTSFNTMLTVSQQKKNTLELTKI